MYNIFTLTTYITFVISRPRTFLCHSQLIYVPLKWYLLISTHQHFISSRLAISNNQTMCWIIQQFWTVSNFIHHLLDRPIWWPKDPTFSGTPNMVTERSNIGYPIYLLAIQHILDKMLDHLGCMLKCKRSWIILLNTFSFRFFAQMNSIRWTAETTLVSCQGLPRPKVLIAEQTNTKRLLA